ncbi:hypothetical protein NST12_16565 [Bacillus sp. FSL W8-1127]|uniref:hypothetical protein n=1 Tax=Bacillus sp. FSL W8-1127 TaxID=2954710 RepID=UPI0030F9F318
MRVENIAGIEVNVDEALQFLLGVGETKIDQEDGYYLLKFDDEGYRLVLTVDYERTVADPEKGLSAIGLNTVFNETYFVDEFSFDQLIEDLHAQNLEDVEFWVLNSLEKQQKF